MTPYKDNARISPPRQVYPDHLRIPLPAPPIPLPAPLVYHACQDQVQKRNLDYTPPKSIIKHIATLVFMILCRSCNCVYSYRVSPNLLSTKLDFQNLTLFLKISPEMYLKFTCVCKCEF